MTDMEMYARFGEIRRSINETKNNLEDTCIDVDELPPTTLIYLALEKPIRASVFDHIGSAKLLTQCNNAAKASDMFYAIATQGRWK